MVRLKDRNGYILNCFLLNFNSTMVRLKGWALRITGIPGRRFQFHYGSIKSFENNYLTEVKSKFQFHYGSIKRSKKKLSAALIALFQFHYGSIKSITQITGGNEDIIFQFHYGSIKSI